MFNIYTIDRKKIGRLSDDTKLSLRKNGRIEIQGRLVLGFMTATFTMTEAMRIGPSPEESVILLDKTLDVTDDGEITVHAYFDGAHA